LGVAESCLIQYEASALWNRFSCPDAAGADGWAATGRTAATASKRDRTVVAGSRGKGGLKPTLRRRAAIISVLVFL
jgi:hypothetical protein